MSIVKLLLRESMEQSRIIKNLIWKNHQREVVAACRGKRNLGNRTGDWNKVAFKFISNVYKWCIQQDGNYYCLWTKSPKTKVHIYVLFFSR